MSATQSTPRLDLEIVVNGCLRQVQAGASVEAVLGELSIPLRGVAVEVNGQIVPRARHAEHRLADGDRLEIVSLVGGG